MFDVYLRRRAVTLLLVGLLVLGGLRFAAPSSGADAPGAYVVQQGDTLWSIAAAKRSPPSTRRPTRRRVTARRRRYTSNMRSRIEANARSCQERMFASCGAGRPRLRIP